MAPILAGMLLTGTTAAMILVADYVLKLAADTGAAATSGLVIGGSLLYLVSGLIWFLAMRHIALGQAAVAYSMISLVGLVLVGVIAFDETFRLRDALGLACALAAMALILKA